MRFFSHLNGRFSLSGLFLLSLSLSRVAIATPVQQDGTVSARQDEGTPITEDEYIAYLKRYYPATERYLLYSGNSVDQLKAFQEAGNNYYWYNDFFDSETSEYFDEAFPPSQNRGDDTEAASTAIAKVATGDIRVFGAVEYQTKGPNSFYTLFEAPYIKSGLADGRLNNIYHMKKGATGEKDYLATEDSNGKISYLDGQSGSNASGGFGDCSSTEDPPTCDTPPN